MVYLNPFYVPIQRLKQDFYDKLESVDSLETEAQNPDAIALDVALAYSDNTNFKIIHPIFLKGWKMPSSRYGTRPLKYIGLDVETNYLTGEPRLIGLYYPDPSNLYQQIISPTLERFFTLIESLNENGDTNNILTWGNLDIQCLLRLFNPTEDERKQISRGISANVSKGQFVANPPIIRFIGKKKTPFYVSHYMPGRSAKIGYIEGGREHTSWIFNLSQFYPGTIAQTSRGLKLPWTEFDKSTHLIDWHRYGYDAYYRLAVNKSNEQDAKTVATLGDMLQARFYEVFESYPRILVSAGSLTDAAVSKMLHDEDESHEEYNSNSWAWLRQHVWQNQKEETYLLDTLLSEAFSAGYVDQFAVGYFPKVSTADISSAYPHKIRSLPDLRQAVFYKSISGDVELDCEYIEKHDKLLVETAIIRGIVTIPTTLHFHPITLKTSNRENYRPTGTFKAAYTLEERRYCAKYGATFTAEEYVIVALKDRLQAPIGGVSETLGAMRERLTKERDEYEKNSDSWIALDGQQYMVKIVDNSIYGKTVMTLEVVENLDDGSGTIAPHVTGYTAGDRFNLLYGVLITSRTRIQLAHAAVTVERAGGKPIMCMTDSLYWEGSPDQLPIELCREKKTAGYFELPHEVSEFYIIKTGQYEYREGLVKWQYKLRGLNADRELLSGTASFFRRIIKDHCANLKSFTHPKDIRIKVETRRLISIGSQDLDSLGKVEEGITSIAPFVLSSKQKERYLKNWKDALDGAIWLETPHIDSKEASPLQYLRNRYESMQETTAEDRAIKLKSQKKARNSRIRTNKRRFIMKATIITEKEPPSNFYQLSWPELEEFYGMTAEEIERAENV